MTAIIEIEGIGEVFAGKLQAANIQTVEDLLRDGGTAVGRRTIAATTGIDESKILEWVNRADLMRIKGVGSEFSDLLEAAGVDTVRELAQRNPANLHAKLIEVNAAKNLVRRLPTLPDVESWVKQAGEMEGAVSH